MSVYFHFWPGAVSFPKIIVRDGVARWCRTEGIQIHMIKRRGLPPRVGDRSRGTMPTPLRRSINQARGLGNDVLQRRAVHRPGAIIATRSFADCIIVTRGYDFREEQLSRRGERRRQRIILVGHWRADTYGGLCVADMHHFKKISSTGSILIEW